MPLPYTLSTVHLTDDIVRLTDDLERQLVLQAIEEQFRPHPLLALKDWAHRLVRSLRRTSGRPQLAHTGLNP